MHLDETPALVAVDLQAATVGLPSAKDMAGVVANAAKLAAAFREAGLLVVAMKADLNDPPPGRAELGSANRPSIPDQALEIVPELGLEGGDLVLSKRGWSAFAGTELDSVLRERGVSQVVLVGLATAYGIESTARAAYDLGYNVAVIEDAINNPQAGAHQNSVENVFPVLGELSSTGDLLEALRQRR